MSQVPLTGAAYVGRSNIASAQETVNLYAELNTADKDAPVPITYYLTPGFAIFAQPNVAGKSRCTYRTSIGTAYTVIAGNVYFVAQNGGLVLIGSIADRESQVIMADNGLVAVLVDGVDGWAIDLTNNSFGPIVDPSFYGADYAVFLDTFFCFNRPKTNQFYISLSMVTFAMLTGTGVAGGNIVGGTLYTNGDYTNVPLTGGSGNGATANITIAGGAISTVDIINIGVGYAVGDVLSANVADIGGTGSGFTYTITATALAFDPLDIAAKAGSADPIVALVTTHKELWLVGALTTEVWYGTGAADFYFQLVQGAYIDHGCAAQYSVAWQDILSFWIMQDKQGQLIIVQAANYEVKEISTPYLVNKMRQYETVADAIGFCFQYNDHAFYGVTFPTGNETYLYDLTTERWTKWAWLNVEDGSLNRHRVNCCMFAFGLNLIGDWENGNIYRLDASLYMDNDAPILRRKTFLHMLNELKRVTYNSFDANIQVGSQDPAIADDTDTNVYLSWSDNRGVSYGFPVAQSLGLGGKYLTTVSWNRLGQARDRVFKLEWSCNFETALNGGFADVVPNRS